MICPQPFIICGRVQQEEKPENYRNHVSSPKTITYLECLLLATYTAAMYTKAWVYAIKVIIIGRFLSKLYSASYRKQVVGAFQFLS